MAEKFKQIPKRIVEIWKNWTKKQKMIIISSTAVFIIAVVLLAAILNQPNYQVLTTCTDYNEMSQVTTLLKDAGYSYKVTDNTLVVKVKKADLTNAKMVIATADIKSDGYSFEDAMESSFTTTDSDKTKKYEHYLESKFASDLESMDGVKSASVTVDIADDTSSFYTSTSESSVSVVLQLSKQIGEDTAESMANFLATAVGNKSTNKITIISSDGSTLFSGTSNSSSNSGVSYNNQQKYKAQIESTVKNSLKQGLLATGLYDDAYLTLNYVLDWDAVNKIATEYSVLDGYEQGLFSHSYEEVSEGSDGASGTPGTTSNQSDDTTYNITDGSNSSSKYTLKKYDYLPNELVTTTTKEPGSIIYDSSTLAVTFIKNIVYREDECKKLGYLDNMSWDEFKSQNASSVVMNVDQQWIDLLSKGTGVNTNSISVLAYQRPYFEDAPVKSTFKTVSFWIQIALAVVILGLLAFVVLRSARPLTVEEKEPELSVEEMLATTKENQPTVDDIDLQEKSETRKAIEKFVDENPEAVALLLRNWLNDGWN
jgi:flagellar M-ring protein FliF